MSKVITTPLPPRPDNTRQNNMFGGIGGPINPYGYPINIPVPNKTS